MSWNFKKYGSWADPIHKSHLNDLTGDYGCPAQFRYKMDERSGLSIVERDEIARVGGKAACGTATHETIARALSNQEVLPRILTGTGIFETPNVRKVFQQELEREVGGREIRWADKDNPGKLYDERAEMCATLLNELHKHVSEVLLVEAGFIVKLGPYWLCGHTDIVYRPKDMPDGIGLADWKTGAAKPDPIELNHGWESGVYSTAVQDGYFLRREECVAEFDHDRQEWVATCRGHMHRHASRYIAEREASEAYLCEVARSLEENPPADHLQRARELGMVAFGQFPSEIYHVHLQDYVRYQKSGKKQAKRAEDLAFYKLSGPGEVEYVKGELRGPAWLPVSRSRYDVPRLEARLRRIVSMIRLGIFVDQVGERCNRCPYASDCLTSGYEVRGAEQKRLEHALLRIPNLSDGFDQPSVPKERKTLR